MSAISNTPRRNDPAWLASLEQAWQIAHDTLQAERTAEGHWTGELSASALSTATAVSALAQSRKSGCICEARGADADRAIAVGCDWLVRQQNADGGFGDTDRSYSNIATTLLVLAAWELAKPQDFSVRSRAAVPLVQPQGSVDQTRMDRCAVAAWKYVEGQGKWDGLRRRYGTDKTFVVPILSNCALAGLAEWRDVAPLPFEAAWLPQELYRWARLPVVSYAVPALVAIGQARFHFAPPKNPLVKAVRQRAIAPTLRVLRTMQPASGGYLEATPLTSFVLMNLAACGQGELPVAQDCVKFLLDARLEDGSWPIDTNLATWVTSLSLHALSRRGPLRLTPRAIPGLMQGATSGSTCGSTKPEVTAHTEPAAAATDEWSPETYSAAETFREASLSQPPLSSQTVRWLLACQHRRRHPFTGANPGGWGWTNLSGAVPDADDTPAALLALSHIDWSYTAWSHIDSGQVDWGQVDVGQVDVGHIDPSHATWARLQHQALDAVKLGLGWLLRLQNRDGGWPTFCRGWGTLPFDRSGTDLTAHALRALQAWLPKLQQVNRSSQVPALREADMESAMRRGLAYLSRKQAADGSWQPLWFGNQDRPQEDNPVYGTGKVLMAYGALGLVDSEQAQRGRKFLLGCQNADGGWGGGLSVKYPGVLATAGQGTGDAQSSQPTSSIEETAIALEGLLCGGQMLGDASIMQGLEWLAQSIRSGNLLCSSPIGFYFAKLWYHERLYPTVFSLAALGTALHTSGTTTASASPSLNQE